MQCCFAYLTNTNKSNILKEKLDGGFNMQMTEKEFHALCKKLNKSPSDFTPKNKTQRQDKFDSLAEKNFFLFYIEKHLSLGNIKEVKLHNEFTIVDAIPEYNLKKRIFKPDFIVITKNNKVFVIEMKGKVIKKLQRDYALRKQLFIQRYCLPNQWQFLELQSENWTQQPFIEAQKTIINFE